MYRLEKPVATSFIRNTSTLYIRDLDTLTYNIQPSSTTVDRSSNQSRTEYTDYIHKAPEPYPITFKGGWLTKTTV